MSNIMQQHVNRKNFCCGSVSLNEWEQANASQESLTEFNGLVNEESFS